MSRWRSDQSSLDAVTRAPELQTQTGTGFVRPDVIAPRPGRSARPVVRQSGATARLRRKKVLLLSDDAQLRHFLAALLSGEAYAFADADIGQLAAGAQMRVDSDLIILDASATGLDQALDSLPQLSAPRSRGIILLADQAGPRPRSRGLEGVVDVIISKPLEPRQILACIRGLLRQADTSNADSKVAAGDATLWPMKGKFRFGPQETRVTWTEGMLLRELIANADVPVAREQLLCLTSGSDQKRQESSLSRHIYRLREKVGSDAAGESPIRTIRGVGYMFVSSWSAGDDD